ncbi:preprotein translocase subunit YajC [Siculibacillus lacustris]|uniref:Sec translocon accessory complex subunit YajC n=1 Tax=Siculibacillus lacustris TaxID=1549641 RepID=A0A4Q9VGV4_9HYPH|nr:preprotein translocase subunit YajC [Siculibacillus lacustris]TBW34285.1 preprotein translocase subunit YajC [Siculibacillus lacustris]
MFVTPAYAQSVGAAGGAGDILMSLVPFAFILVIMWVMVIRPQRQRQKAHEELVKNLRRGDIVVAAGGIIAKVSKVVGDAEVEVEIAEGVKIRVVRSTVTEVRAKGEPAKAKPEAANE